METTEQQVRTVPARAAGRLQAGITLIEIMIVLGIIAAIAALVGPRVIAALKSSKKKTAWVTANALTDAYAQWHENNADEKGECPSGLEDLRKYTNKAGKKGPIKDPWGTEFIMRCGEGLPEGVDFGVTSAGPDKKEGTADDINSWDDKPKD